MNDDIRNLTFDDIKTYLVNSGEKPFRAEQVFDWLYQKKVTDFSQMKNLPAALQNRLRKDFPALSAEVVQKNVSEDGTAKALIRLSDNEMIETVMIPTENRSTVCVSSQAGCKFGCRFCASGIGGWKRNLTPAEILFQVQLAQELANPNPLSHIVFMGVGEPMDNYDNVMKAIRIINDAKGINIGARRITVSTCGVIPKILQMGKEGIQIELAISLHGFDNESRNVLMPVNRKYPFEELIDACREYQKNYRRQITFEYILIKDVTCTPEAANALKKAFKGLLCKMNLIPYNPVSEFDHKTPSRTEIFAFRDRLKEFGVHATVRMPRGRDVSAACGQLRHSVSQAS